VRRAGITIELCLRVVTTPEPATAQFLAHLGLRLPKDTCESSNVVPEIASQRQGQGEAHPRFSYLSFSLIPRRAGRAEMV
jgi:hypothetical protein